MTTDLFNTGSEGGTVSNVSAVEEWLQEYHFTVEANIEQKQITFWGDFSPFAIESRGREEEVTKSALSELQNHLDTDLEIRSVQSHGRGTVAYKWVVPADGGEVERHDF